MGKLISRNKVLLIMLVPALIYVIVFSYIPMAGIVLAFKNYRYADGIFGSPWVGLDNFKFLFVSNKVWQLTRNTLLYNIAFIIFGMIFEVGFAIILSELNNKVFKKFAQGFMFLPYFISWVVVSTIMLNIFGDNGVLNSILLSAGGEKYSIYSIMASHNGFCKIVEANRIWNGYLFSRYCWNKPGFIRGSIYWWS